MADAKRVVWLEIDGSSGSPVLEGRIAAAMQEYFELWKIKQRKYGTQNIAAIGRAGIFERAISDKGNRLRRFIYEGLEGDDEGTEADAWLDLAGYGLIGLMVHRGQWPGLERQRVTWRNVWFVLRQFLHNSMY